MERIQPFFKLNKKSMCIEAWSNQFNTLPTLKVYSVNEEELPIVEKLLQRDFKTAILFRKSHNEGISAMCDDIIQQRG